MLKTIVDQLESFNVSYHIVDDGSTNHPFGGFKNVKSFEHGGKQKFWERYQYGLDYALASDHDNYIFMPDDFLDLKLDQIKLLFDAWQQSEFAVNIINDGREHCWGNYRLGLKPIPFLDNVLTEVGFNDCGFISNRLSIRNIKLVQMQDAWFDRPDKSSGVGFQLTNQMRKLGIPMLKPQTSLAYHGEHESKMHGEHRNQVQLKSI